MERTGANITIQFLQQGCVVMKKKKKELKNTLFLFQCVYGFEEYKAHF